MVVDDEIDLLDRMLAALYRHDEAERIVRVNEPGGDPAPRFALVRSAAGVCWRLRSDVPDAQAAEITRTLASDAVSSGLRHLSRAEERVTAILGGEVSHFGPEHQFPVIPSVEEGMIRVDRSNVALLKALGWRSETLDIHFEAREPYFAIVEEGAAVSISFSSRLTPEVAMAGVNTLPEYRGRGLAAKVTAAWAAEVKRSGRVPIYGTTWENAASLGVARKLSLIPFAISLSVE